MPLDNSRGLPVCCVALLRQPHGGVALHTVASASFSRDVNRRRLTDFPGFF